MPTQPRAIETAQTYASDRSDGHFNLDVRFRLFEGVARAELSFKALSWDEVIFFRSQPRTGPLNDNRASDIT